MFCDGFKFNLVRFNDYKKLMHDLCVIGQNRMAFFHPTSRLVLHPTLLQEANLNLNLWEHEVDFEKSITWVLCVIFPIGSRMGHFLKF